MKYIGQSRVWYIVLITIFLLCNVCAVYGEADVNSTSESTKTGDISHWLSELEKRKPLKTVKPNMSSEKLKPVTSLPVPTIDKKVTARPALITGEPARVSVDFYKVDLHNVFRLLGEISGMNIVVDENVEGTLTLALKDVPWTFILDVIKNLKGLKSIERENTIMIFPADMEVAWGSISKGKGKLDITEDISVTEPEVEGFSFENVSFGEQTENKASNARGTSIFIKNKNSRAISLTVKELKQFENLWKKACNAERSGNLLETYKLLMKASEIWPDNYDLNKKLSVMAFRQGRELDAYNYARKAVLWNRNDSDLLSLLGVICDRMGKKDEAAVWFEQAMQSGEDIARETYWNYIVFLFNNKDYKNSLRLLDKLENTYELTFDMIMLRARIFEKLGQEMRAVKEYNMLLNAGNNVPEDMLIFARNRLAVLSGQ
jgi:type IV pilus assembly protein PilQ